MELINFCRAHGILIDSPPPIGVWRRYPTDDHPNKRNGAVKFMGDHAFVQNHALDVEVSVWQPEYAQAIERYDTHWGSGLFEFILLLIVIAALAFSIGWWL